MILVHGSRRRLDDYRRTLSLSCDVLAIVGRHDPARWTGTLRRRAKMDLPFDASRVPEGAPLLLDTTVYIDQLKGDLPRAIVSLISSRTIFHATPALAEIAVTVGASIQPMSAPSTPCGLFSKPSSGFHYRGLFPHQTKRGSKPRLLPEFLRAHRALQRRPP